MIRRGIVRHQLNHSNLTLTRFTVRKARNQANELTRERDSLLKQLETARNEARDSQRELVNARQSVIEQKQSLESRLDEERRAKERTRAQLDARMEELQRRKSKFACM
jgi:chromosome segregation ATPase